MIAGMVQDPNGYNPTQHPLTAKKRRNIVLARMRDLGYIAPPKPARQSSPPWG